LLGFFSSKMTIHTTKEKLKTHSSLDHVTTMPNSTDPDNALLADGRMTASR
jgi:hypothetical protein